MSELNQARRKFKFTQSKKQDTSVPISALLGRGNGTVSVPNQAGQVYIRVGNQENYGTAYNDRVPLMDNLPVFVGYDPFTDPDRRLFQVLTIRQSAYVDAGNPPIATVGPHHTTHEFGGGDDVYIGWRRMMGLRVGRPALFVVTVDPGYIYRGTSWIAAPVGATTADLTLQHAALAGSQAQYVLISLTSTGAISVLPAGTIKASPALLLPGDIPTPPAGNIPLAAVRIYAAQTAIGDSPAAPDIIDLRFPTYATMNNGGVAGLDTEIQYNNGGVFGAESDLAWDDINKSLLIGGPHGIGALGNNSTINTGEGHSGTFVSIVYGTNNPAFAGFHARGTLALPTKALSGDYLAYFSGRGYATTLGWEPGSRGGVAVVAAEDHENAAHGTNVMIRATPIGSTTIADVALFDNASGIRNLAAETYSTLSYVLTAAKTGTLPVGAGSGVATRLATWLDANEITSIAGFHTFAGYIVSSFQDEVIGLTGHGFAAKSDIDGPAVLALYSAGYTPQIQAWYGNGTLGTPTAVIANDVLCTIHSEGYSVGGPRPAAEIAVVALENFVWATNSGSRLEFRVTPTGTSSWTIPAMVAVQDWELRLSGSTSGYVGFKSPAAPTSITYILPAAAAVGVLTSDIAGNLTWNAAPPPGVHDMIAVHSYTGGAALDVFGLSAANTIALLTPSSAPGAASAILKSDAGGGLTLAGALGCGSPFTITNPTGPASLTVDVAATTGIVTLTAAGTTPGIRINNEIGINTNPLTGYGLNVVGSTLVSSTSGPNNYVFTYSSTVATQSRIQLAKSHSDILGTYAQTVNGEFLGMISYFGIDTGANLDRGASIYAIQVGDSGTRIPTELAFLTASATALIDRVLVLTSVGGAIINDTGLSTAVFRVEGDTDANLICTDAANDKLGVGTAMVGAGVTYSKFNVNGSQLFVGADSTQESPMFQIVPSYVVNTHASYTTRTIFSQWAIGGAQECMRFESGASAMLGFYGGAAVVRGAALTAQLTTITHTAPGTSDYALQDLVQNTGFGFVTKDEGNSTLAVVANLQARVAQLEARLGSATGVNLFA